VLPASRSQVPLDVTGAFFRCAAASAGQFEMSFDGSTFFVFEKGLQFKLVAGDTFQKLWFRAANASANTLTVYYGTVQVDDNRLNIISGSDAATIYTKPAPTLVHLMDSGSLAAGTTATLTAFAAGQHSIIVSNNANTGSNLSLDLLDDGGGLPVVRIPCATIFEIITPQELYLRNNEASAIPFAYSQTIYA
jgi:hypothetical protein